MTNYEMFLAAAFVALIFYTVGIFCILAGILHYYFESSRIDWKNLFKILSIWTIFNFLLTGLIYLIIFTAVRSGIGT